MTTADTVDDAVASLFIENVVVSSGINRELDLEELAMDLQGTEYDQDNFPGLVWRFQDPRASILMFRSGKIVCTGTKSIEDAERILERVAGRLQDLGITAELSTPTVQNLVSTADLKDTLNLNAAAVGLGLEQVEYEPEQFPGLVYRLSDPDVVVLLFGSGRAVVTGAKTQEASEQALRTTVDALVEMGLI